MGKVGFSDKGTKISSSDGLPARKHSFKGLNCLGGGVVTGRMWHISYCLSGPSGCEVEKRLEDQR